MIADKGMQTADFIEAFEGAAAKAGGDAIPHEWNALTHQVIGICMEVHTALGPGLPERLYEAAIVAEFRRQGVAFEQQKCCKVQFKGETIGEMRFDLVVGGVLILEFKALQAVPQVHLSMLVSYLRASKLPLGLLINFNTLHLRDGIFRRVNLSDRSSRPTP